MEPVGVCERGEAMFCWDSSSHQSSGPMGLFISAAPAPGSSGSTVPVRYRLPFPQCSVEYPS